MTEIWERAKKAAVWYNKEEFIPRRDIRNVLWELIKEGDNLKETIENGNEQEKAYRKRIDELKEKLDASNKEGLEHHAIAVEYYEKLEAIQKWFKENEDRIDHDYADEDATGRVALRKILEDGT